MPDDVFAVSLAEAARRLSICPRSVWNLVKRGELPARKIGARTVIRVADLTAFLEKTKPAGAQNGQ
jgi:excisionase family DNA binding protein